VREAQTCFRKRGELVKRTVFQVLVQASLTIAALLVVSIGLAGAPQRPSPKTNKEKAEKGAGPDAEAEFRRDAEKVVGEIALEALSDDKWIKVERIEKALLFYSDPTRNNDRGSVWGWGRKGRPRQSRLTISSGPTVP